MKLFTKITLTTAFLVSGASLAQATEFSVNELQEAYTRAAALPGSKHRESLQIVGSECEASGEKFSCQIGFVIANEDANRVYLDVATLKRDDNGQLLLTSGLCLR